MMGLLVNCDRLGKSNVAKKGNGWLVVFVGHKGSD